MSRLTRSLELLRRVNMMRVVGGSEDFHTIEADQELDHHDYTCGWMRPIERNNIGVEQTGARGAKYYENRDPATGIFVRKH